VYESNSPYHHSAPYAAGAYEPATGTTYQTSYVPPGAAPRASGGGWARNAGAGAVGVGLLLAKTKGLLFALLSLKWLLLGKGFLISGISFLASIWFYALFFGWKFAIVLVLLLLVHELGHTVFMRAFGLPASLPYFIPGFGAFVSLKARPASLLHTSYIALGGPLVGGLASAVCYFYGDATNNIFWIACAYTGFLINLINLMPVPPLDGGTVVASISPKIWTFGLILFVVGSFALHFFSPIFMIIIIFALPTIFAAWRTRRDPDATPIPLAARVGVGAAYFALIAMLGVAMHLSQISVPHA
jgi:Zn-dependent protease